MVRNGIIIHQGNRLEELARHLGEEIQAARRKSFTLEPATVLVNNYEMAQWLANTVAEDFGVCANVDFMLVGSFIWRLAMGERDRGGASADMAPLAGDRMKWLVFRALQDISRGEAEGDFALLRYYMKSQGEKGTFHLSEQIAVIFDRYLSFRHDMLFEWENGEGNEHGWQPELWRIISGMTGGRLRISFLERLLKELGSGKSELKLPSRLFLFAVSSLPPLHLDIVSALSGIIETHLFFMNPCRQFWEDVLPEKKRAGLKARLAPEKVDAWFPAGNSLLASLGYSGRAFLSRLYSMPIEEGRDFFRENGDGSMLSMIQDDILDLNRPGSGAGDRAKRVVKMDDSSLRINICHSRMREVEALHDELVRIFDESPGIFPHDCLVMAPSMEDYAPLVKGVFGAAPERRFIPYTISDIGMIHDNPVSKAFLDIMGLPLSDFTATEIMDIISLPEVSARFDISEEELPVLHEWVRESGIRRGVGTGAPECQETGRQNSWAFGLDRLFMSHAFNSDKWCLGILPSGYAIEGANARLLSTLSGFVHGLFDLCKTITREERFSPSEWLDVFEGIVSDFISFDPWEDRDSAGLLTRLKGLAEAMEEAGVQDLEYDVIYDVVKGELGRPSPQRAFFSGRVLFSSLVPMRTIPFKIICLLGMNDTDFPRRPGAPGFDIMARRPRPGDRIPREEDRYLFLETLISARKKLIISYVGRSEQDDSVQNPSVVLSELTDYMDREFWVEGSSPDTPASSYFSKQYPLQPFSMRYLEEGSDLVTYAAEWMPVDETGKIRTREEPPAFCVEPVPISDTEQDALASIAPWQLTSFFTNPVRYFLRERFHIDLYKAVIPLEDSEPFSFSKNVRELFLRELSGLKDEEFVSTLKEPDAFLNSLLVRLKGMGLAPLEPFASLLWQGESSCFSGFLEKIAKKVEKTGLPLNEKASVNRVFKWPDHTPMAGKEVHVAGNLGPLSTSGGLFDIRFELYNSLRMTFWIKHLLLICQGTGKNEDKEISSIIINSKTPLVIRGMPGGDAEALMDELLGFYIKGMEMPLKFFLDASYAFAKQKMPARGEPASDEDAALKAVDALSSWHSKGTLQDIFLSFMYRGSLKRVADIVRTDEEFRETGMAICGSMLDFMKTGR